MEENWQRAGARVTKKKKMKLAWKHAENDNMAKLALLWTLQGHRGRW